MGAKSLVMLKRHIHSINICFGNDFVYGNVLWALASLRVFFFNYVLYSLGLLLRYIFRFQVEDRKSNHRDQPVLADQTKRDQYEDSDEIDGLAKELADLLFPGSEDFHSSGEGREDETEYSVSGDTTVSDRSEESKSEEKGETENSVLMEKDSGTHEETTKREQEEKEEFSISLERFLDVNENDKGNEGEVEGSDSVNSVSDVHQDVKETEQSVIKTESDSNVHEDGRKIVEEIQEDVVMDCESIPTTSKYQFVSGKDISCFMEEPTALTFSFREFYAVSQNSFAINEKNVNKEVPKFDSKEGPDAEEEEEEESAQEQKMSPSSSYDDNLLYNDELLPSDSESESSTSSSLIWANNNDNTDQVLSSHTSYEEFEPKSLNEFNEERIEDVEDTQFSLERNEETLWEDNFDELDSDEEEEEEDEDDDMEWENEFVEQMKMELRNARQGGLATILEKDEEECEETESPKIVEYLKPLKIDEKVQYKDHLVEIHKVYKGYAEKMRKLDILNYQTMHAIGLLQRKDPLKLILMSKSTVQGSNNKSTISQNLWLRKAPKHSSDPMLKFVKELHRELELVYVGQLCLSWEILCWQHKKILELQHYDSQWPRRYNLVAGEFQTFQVLVQRFIENEPFQDPRIQNYVKNRFSIRNLLQVPVVKDDNTKDKKVIKWGDEDVISSAMLGEIMKESMRLLWEFVRADKECGNVNLKVSQQIGNDVKDPAISDLLVEIQIQLHKKERKLKDIVRSGNCIVRKFQKHHEDKIQLDHEQLIAQVGLRLISRVMNMKKLRKDQVIWCHEKLNCIKFVGMKIHLEPFFSLFPC